MFGIALAVAGVDLTVKAWARQVLPAGGWETGPVDLQLAYNPGVAFSVGAAAPGWVLVVITAAVTAAVAALAWRAAPAAGRMGAAALAAVLGGAVGNLTDRAGDGVVTDYLHTGWWPTFNLADCAVVLGACALLLSSIRRAPGSTADLAAAADGGAGGGTAATPTVPRPGAGCR